MIQTTSKRGGARRGAGRKPEGKIQVTYKLAPDVVEFLRNHRPASKTIEEAVRLYAIKHKTSNTQASE